MDNNQFLLLMRQYASLENRTGKDYTEQVQVLADQRYSTMLADGVEPEQAVDEINQALTNQRLRFPFEFEPTPQSDIPF